MQTLISILRVLPFLLAALLILFGGHFLLYKSAVSFFQISRPQTKQILAATLAFLSVAFFFASFWSRFQDNFFARSFYIFSGVWLGLLLYLLIASALIWAVVLASKILGANINIFPIAIIGLLLALVYTSYGVWNAFHPVVKNIEVQIKNLPDSWKNKTIVQLSDVHLGHVHRINFLQNLVEQTNRLKPEAIFITGDLFDGMGDSLGNFIPLLNQLDAPSGIFFVTGNHETYLGLEKTYSILSKTKIRILNDELVDLSGLQLIGASYPLSGQTKDIKSVISRLNNFDPQKPSILLYHPPLPSQINQAKAAGINLQLAGHAHKGQVFPFEFITRLVYKGYDYGLHQDGNYFEYTTTGAGTWGPPLRTANSPEIVAIKF